MNDLKIKELLKKDSSTPKAPSDELTQIYQKIESKSVNLFDFFNSRSIALTFCLVFVVVGANLTFIKSSSSTLTESEQQELIEFMLEDAYLNNGEISYAWIETSS